MPIGRSSESSREAVQVDDVELRINESDPPTAPVVDSSVESAYRRRATSISPRSSPHAHGRQTGDHLAPMKAVAGHVIKVGTDRLEETKHTLEKGAKKLHLKQKDHKKRLATEEKERWVPSAIPTAQFNYWVVLPSHLSPVEEGLLGAAAGGEGFRSEHFTATISQDHPIVLLATKQAGGNAEMARKAIHIECRNIVLYMENFRSLILNKLGQVNTKLAKRIQIHTHVHLWKAPSCFTPEGDVLYDELAEDKQQQEAALLTVQRVVEFPEPRLHLVGETLQAVDLAYLSNMVCEVNCDTVAFRFPHLVRALRDHLTTASGTAAPMTEFSKVDVEGVLTASTVTVAVRSASLGSRAVVLVGAPVSVLTAVTALYDGPTEGLVSVSPAGYIGEGFVLYSCPPSFEGTKQNEVIRGALASFVGDIVQQFGMAKLLFLLSLLTKPKGTKPQPLELGKSEAATGLGQSKMTEAQANGSADELRDTIQSVLGKSLKKLVKRWARKMDWTEKLLAKSTFIETSFLAPDCHLAKKLTSDQKPLSLRTTVWWIVTYLWENEFDKMKVVLVCVIVQSWWVFLFPILLSDLIMQAKRATGVVKDNSPIFGFLAFFDTPQQNAMLLLGCMLVGFTIDVFLNKKFLLTMPTGNGFATMFRFKMMRHLSRLPYTYQSVADTSRIISSLQNDVPIISDTVGATVTLLRLLLIMNASFVLLLLLNWRLALLCLVSFPLYFVSFRRNSINTSRSAFLYRSMDKKYISLMDELLRHWTCIRTLGSSERALGKLQESAVSTRTIAATGKLHNAVGTTNNQAIGYLQNFFLLVIGTYFMIYTSMPVPIFMAFYVAAGKLDAQMPKVASCLATLNQEKNLEAVGNRAGQAQGALTSLLSISSVREEDFHLKTPVDCHEGIRVVDLEMYYDIAEIGVNSRPVLSGINLFIPAGTSVGILGKSRAGKSTLLGLMARLLQPTSGVILWDGIPLNEIDLYSSLTLVLQETLLFNDTILGNLLLGVKEAPSDAVIKRVLQTVNLWDDVQQFPLKLQTPAGINGSRLSGGFRQRMSVARGILCNRSVMLLDEPTSAQDQLGQQIIAKSLAGLTLLDDPSRHVLVMAVSHSITFLENFNSMMVVANNTVSEYGTRDQLMEKKGDFYRMKMAQQGIQMSEKGAAQLSPMHLQQMWMFRSVPVLSLSKVASLFTSRTLTAGSTLYKPGDLGDTLYVVVAGVVTEMTYEQADGDAIDVEEGEQEESAKPAARATAQVSYGVGDCLGDEHLAYADGFDCQSTASVMETATVMCLSRSMLEKAMDEDSELMEAVQMEVKMKEYILSAAFLRQVWIFSLMTDEQLERIAPCFESSILDIGVVVNLANALYLVAGGALSYTQRVMGGLTQTLTASPASSLGELEIMGLPGPSCAPVKVLMERTFVFCLKSDALQALFAKHEDMRQATQKIVDLRQAALDGLSSHYLLGHALQGATHQQRKSLLDAFVTRSVPDSTRLWHSLAPCNAFTLFLSGSTEVTLGLEGEPTVTTKLSAGQSTAETSLFGQDGWLTTTNALVQKPAVVLQLSSATFQQLMRVSPQRDAMMALAARRVEWLSVANMARLPLPPLGEPLAARGVAEQMLNLSPRFVAASAPAVSNTNAQSLLVVLHGTVTWTTPSPGKASAGQVVVSPKWADKLDVEGKRNLNTIKALVASNPTASPDAAATVLEVDMERYSAAATTKRLNELAQMEGDMQIMRKKLLERKLLRQRLSKLNKILMVNNAVERVHNARNLAVYRASKGLVHSVQRSNRWHFFMTMFKMTRVFTSMQENEVGGLDECIEYLKTKCDELLAECEERKAKTAVKSDELRMVWGQLHESLDPQQLALLEVSDEYDLSAARLQVLEFMLGDAKIELARRVILSEEEMTECEHLMALMDITPVSPLYARRSELHGRGVLDTQMTALHRKLVHLQEERDRREDLKRTLEDEMHHTCTLCKLKPMEHFLPQIEPYRQLIDDTAMDAYDSAVTTMRKQLAKNYNALVNTNRELYTVLRVDETHKREFGSQVNWVNMEVAQQEHERMQHMVTVVKRAGGTVGRAIIPAPPPPAPSPATSLTERELCQQRHDKNIEKLNTLHARLNTNPAMVRASRDQLSQMNMQNLIQLEEVLAGLQQTLLNGKGEEADLVLRVQQVEDYVADGQLIAAWLQKPVSYQNRGSLLFYIHSVAKRLRSGYDAMQQVMADLKTGLEVYDKRQRVPLKSLFGGTAAEVLAAASLGFNVITAEVLNVGRPPGKVTESKHSPRAA